MIDTGATCLTLPPEIFDVVFKYIPFVLDCNENSTLCYIDPELEPNGDDEDSNRFNTFDTWNVEDFGVFSFRMSHNGARMFIPIIDLIIALEGDSGTRYCIERGTYSSSGIGHCHIEDLWECTRSGLIIFGTKAL